ncbi:DUF1150 family protein [Amylibacter sp. IMCC11727]|uniref:DUF1150 family protein n=1 Tax=Amylibacter sp. IMCC11727 TaxID=3039851 RepID=UPI00244DA9F7|nr:DUF1150 family protein [Amylibacter sp. IMCC11727]WGI21008.1 DUF1150 family protein [Amylibacter sp. IMCC11727]
MNVKFNFDHENLDRVVYVRAVDVSELPEDVRAQVSDTGQVYAIHSEDGEQLALAKDRAVAFAIARTNEFAPVSVH